MPITWVWLMATAFTLSSPTIRDKAAMPAGLAYDKHGCTGQNKSPALRWSGAPTATKSFALIMFDPDARKGQGWTHWVIYGIAPTTTSLDAGTAPGASGTMDGKNTFGDMGYDGPCPPVGDPPHHYVFTLYALDTAPRTLQPGLDRDGLLHAMKGHTLASTTLTGTFGRSQ
jgi:Raf kinase inhibitor-like YbhB/YbcL family protein